MSTLILHRVGLLMLGFLAGCVCLRAQEFEVDVKFVETSGWDHLAESSEAWSGLANRGDVRILATPIIITDNGHRAGVRLDSTTTHGAGVGALVTPSLARGGIRVEGQAAVRVQSGPGSKRQGSRPALETITSAFNRTVLPGQALTIHLGRRWETIEDRSSRGRRSSRVNVPFDYYVCLSAVRVR